MTRTTHDVLRVLLDGLRDELHGLEICRRTGLGSGTTYLILARLERDGLGSEIIHPTDQAAGRERDPGSV